MFEPPHDDEYEADLAIYARLGLRGNTPVNLLILSIGVDRDARWLRIHGHFDAPPSEQDIDDIEAVGTEIAAQWLIPGWGVSEDWEVLAPGHEPNMLPGGIAWRRGGPEPPLVLPKYG